MGDQKLGRPTEYSDEKLALGQAYLDGGWEEEGDSVPQVIGLAMAMGVGKTTIYEWAKDDGKKAFRDILTRVQQLQERKLINGGLDSSFNPAVTKMLLVKHGYSDKVEQSHTSPDGSMSPNRGKSLDDFYGGEDLPAKP